MRVLKIVAALTLVAVPLAAQTVPQSNAEDQFVQRLQALFDLPRITASLRDVGVPDSTVRSLLYAMDDAKLPEPQEVAALTVARDAAQQNGPANNFGAFVQRRLAAGDRGQVLAKAIRAEHLRQRSIPSEKDKLSDSARSHGLRRQTEFPRGPEYKEAPKTATPDHN
jgi:hypothetical protein